MPSKKGILITAAIAAAVVGTSFIVWFIPTTSDNQSPPSNAYQEVYSSVYTGNNETAAQVDKLYQHWLSNKTDATEILTMINQSLNQTEKSRAQLGQAQPSLQWQPAFSEYIKALDSFTKYLREMQSMVRSGKIGPGSVLAADRQEWLQHVNASISAVPIS